MGFLSGLFGGGSKTVVEQSSSNTTNVDVTNQIANIIDVTAFAEAIKSMGLTVGTALSSSADQTRAFLSSALTATNEQTKALFSLGILTSAAATDATAKAAKEQNALLSRGLDMLKIGGVVVAVWYVWRKI